MHSSIVLMLGHPHTTRWSKKRCFESIQQNPPFQQFSLFIYLLHFERVIFMTLWKRFMSMPKFYIFTYRRREKIIHRKIYRFVCWYLKMSFIKILINVWEGLLYNWRHLSTLRKGFKQYFELFPKESSFSRDLYRTVWGLFSNCVYCINHILYMSFTVI